MEMIYVFRFCLNHNLRSFSLMARILSSIGKGVGSRPVKN